MLISSADVAVFESAKNSCYSATDKLGSQHPWQSLCDANNCVSLYNNDDGLSLHNIIVNIKFICKRIFDVVCSVALSVPLSCKILLLLFVLL